MGHDKTNKFSVLKHCEVYNCRSKEECDDKMFGICEDLAISKRFPILILSSRHSETGMARFLMDKCAEVGWDINILEKAPIYFANAFKSQPYCETIGRIISVINTHNVNFVVLDNCITNPLYYSPIANLYDISMLALNIKEQTED